jgi:hypothetical protein
MRNLLDSPSQLLQVVLSFCDIQTIFRFSSVCKRFCANFIVSRQFLAKYLVEKTRSAECYLDIWMNFNDRQFRTELERLLWKQRLVEAAAIKRNPETNICEFEDFVVGHHQYPLPVAPEVGGGVGYPRLIYDDEFIILCSMAPEDVFLGENLSRFEPAIVYDANTLELIGFLPFQTAFQAAIFQGSQNKFLITNSKEKIYSTSIRNNILRSKEDLASFDKSSVQLKKLIFEVVEEKEIENICFDANWMAIHIGSDVKIYQLTDEVASFGSNEELKSSYGFTSREFKMGELSFNFIDSKLQLFLMTLSEGKIEYTFYGDQAKVEPKTLLLKSELWPDWDEKRIDMGNYGVFYDAGVLALKSSFGHVLLFKLNKDYEFKPFRQFFDESFELFAQSAGDDFSYDEYFPRVRLQSGILLTSDYSGLGIVGCNLNSQVGEGCFAHLDHIDISEDEFLECGRLCWSHSGRHILFAREGGDLYVFDVQKLCL